MAANLTGDFDLVAEFAIPAANRVLAAMHRSERFPHSASVQVDDNPPLGGPHIPRPTVIGSVDGFGDPPVNHEHIVIPDPFPGPLAATDSVRSGLGVLVNPGLLTANPGTIVPSHLQGRAQLQLFPPTLEVPDSSGKQITVRLNLMSRYFPDPNTSPLAEFIRGDLQITASVDEVTSQAANVIDINFKADQADINFTPSFASQALSPEDLAGIDLLIRNILKTSVLPSSAPLPPNVAFLQFKTLLGTESAVAALLNIVGPSGDPASMNGVFLGPGDDFAFAAGIDYLRAALKPTLDNILSQSYSFTVPIDLLVTTVHVSYNISLNSAALDLQNGQNGKIVLTIQGEATQTSHKGYAPQNFTFTARLEFTLQVSGATANLVPGDVSLDTSSWLVNLFQGSATNGMRQVRDDALNQSGAYDTVRSMFDANANLGGFLNSLLAPARPKIVFQPQEFLLAYASVDIQPNGIILHGSLAVLDSRPVAISEAGAGGSAAITGWPPPHVEFEQIPITTGGHRGIVGNPFSSGPDYSALKTWIPGGTITQYEWSTQNQGQIFPFAVEPNQFVLLHSGPASIDTTLATNVVSAYTPLCLTVRGTRITASGPEVDQPVSGTVCGYNSVSVIPGGLVTSPAGGALPMLTLAHRGTDGQVVVAGHTAAQPDTAGRGTPNLIVHFADENTMGQLDVLTQALSESKRENAGTAVVAVIAPDQLAKARYAPGIIYADNQAQAWERVYGVKSTHRPLTLIVAPTGKILWQHEGEPRREALAAAINRHLVSCGSGWVGMFRPNVRIGQPAPDFLFEYAPGRQLTLRKLAGRPVVLVFWRSSSKVSLAAVRDLQKTPTYAGGPARLVLAINDGEPADLAKRIAAENGFSANLATDPDREISLAYGVSLWPTIVFVDSSGLITGIRHGYVPSARVEPSQKQSAA